MRIKSDFVTNSSSTSYIIKNVSKTDNLTSRSFVESIWPFIQYEIKYYDFNYSKEDLIKSLENDYKQFPLLPLQENVMIWGDEDCTIAGKVFDYILRGGLETGLVSIKFKEYLR